MYEKGGPMNRSHNKWKMATGLFFFAIVLLFAAPVAQAASQSQNVAIIGGTGVYHGGCIPTTNAAFSIFNFTSVTAASFNANPTLGPGGACGALACDTVLLNVGGTSGMVCNMNNLSVAAKTALVNFVGTGGKLIISDSECTPAQNYSWLPYPFTTNNPGAMGAPGQLTIVEDNVLSSANAASPYYINEVLLETQTDAIGDMNVMTTYNANWCLDMSGTNYNQVTGPVHTYARYGNGLIIYNGFDQDYDTCNVAPSSATGAGNLAKVWYQELMTPFNPTPVAALPCGIVVVGINLTPATAMNELGMKDYTHTVTAHLTDLLNNPKPGVAVTFTVAGTNAGVSGTGTSDAAGNVIFTYSGTTKGQDTITACFVDQAGQTICSQPVNKDWVMKCDLNNDNKIDRNDISIIMAGRGIHAPGDARDVDKDGNITILDARICALQCTNPSCAP
jgi:hypothetical protein